MYITPVINIQLHCAMKTDDKNLLFQQSKKKKSTLLESGVFFFLFQMCSGTFVPPRAWGSSLCNWSDIYINMRNGAGSSLLICSKARTCSLVKRRADRREMNSLAVLRWLLHNMRFSPFSFQMVGGKRLKESLIREEKCLGRF